MGVGAVETEAWDAAAASVEPMAGLLWAAAGAAVAVEGTVVAAVAVVGGGAAVAARLGWTCRQREERSCAPGV